MNENVAGPDEMLNLVTADSGMTEVELGPEGQSLREAWTEFGRLLEAAHSADVMPPLSVPMPTVSPASRRRPWFVAVFAGALAASLLLGVVMYWNLGAGSTNSTVANDDKPSSKPAVQSNKSAMPQDAIASSSKSVDAPAWDDAALDEQIASARQGIALAQSELSHAVGDVDLTRERFRQAQQDLEDNKL
jgi:hypothetical protein